MAPFAEAGGCVPRAGVGESCDRADEYVQLSSSTISRAVTLFTEFMMDEFFSRYLRPPTRAEIGTVIIRLYPLPFVYSRGHYLSSFGSTCDRLPCDDFNTTRKREKYERQHLRGSRTRKNPIFLAFAEPDHARVCLVPTHHAPSFFIVRPSHNYVNCLIDGLNIGLSHHPATHHLRMVSTAYALELSLQRRVGHHGY